MAIFPERSKGVISSVIGYAFAGSNPADSINEKQLINVIKQNNKENISSRRSSVGRAQAF